MAEGDSVMYQRGEPPEANGVYACRVPSTRISGWHDDMFLVRNRGTWRDSSGHLYTGEVTGWVGPLQRRMV